MAHDEETLDSPNRAMAHNPARVWAVAHQGETHCLMGRYEQALSDFNCAIALDPTYAWAIAHRGETYHRMGRYEQALSDLSRAIDLDPRYAWAIAHRGVTYRRLKRCQEALCDLDRAIQLQPDYAWASLHRANVYVATRCYEAALADVDRIVVLDQTIIPHWQGERGLLLNYLGRYAETIKSCRQALQEDPADHVVWYSLATAQACWKGRAEAQTDIDRARAALLPALNTGVRALVLYRLGGLAALEGQVDQALDYLREAIPLHGEPAELARHDPAWLGLRADARFRSLISELDQPPVSVESCTKISG
jgi:tetratricopeptide (TPR) repeat protein